TANRSGNDPRDHHEQQIQPEQTRDQTFGDKFGQSPLQVINATDKVSLEPISAAESTKVVHNIDTIFGAMRLNQLDREDRFLPIIRHKTLGYARVLWLRHDLHHFFVTNEKRKRRAI